MGDSAANICKSNGNLTKFQSEIAECRTSDDVNRINTFLSKIDDIHGFFDSQFAQFNDMLSAGDKFYGTSAPSTILVDISSRNKELTERLESLKRENKKLTSSTERHERDFLDVKGALPDQLPTQRLHVLDDYTMLLLTIAYLLMALSILFYYVQSNSYSINSIGLGTVGLAILTCIVYMMALFML